jgi:hypothetical protein
MAHPEEKAMFNRVSPSLVAVVVLVLAATTLLPACQQATAGRRPMTLESGSYVMKSTWQLEGDPTPQPRTNPVTVTNTGGDITILIPSQRKYPISGTLRGSEFHGTMLAAGGLVELVGKLTVDSRLEGDVFRVDANKNRMLIGHFTIEPAPEK